ncbi:MAG: CpaF family protein [Proteobacteria bacterium]|nr:CpaF family protein [Pseudomonadota bacterium]
MTLMDRLRGSDGAPQLTVVERRDRRGDAETAWQGMKSRIHARLLDEVDLTVLSDIKEQHRIQDLEQAIRQLIGEETRPMTSTERDKLVEEIKHEVMGLGPLEPLLADPTVSDILVNNHKMVYVERRGRLERVRTRFKDDSHLLQIIDKIATSVGRRIDESSPMVDARLIDGSRVNAIIPPLALDGPSLSIRKFAVDPLKVDDLIRLGAFTREMALLLDGIVKARLNVVISGGTGTGKTTFLNVLSAFIPEHERIVTIEDSAELQLQQEHIVRLETRPANLEGFGQITQRDLVRNALRMRPDRVIVGEVRSDEALDMMQAMNTGHDGSLATIHANSPRDALTRLETMIAMSGVNIPPFAMRRQIASAVDVVIQLARLSDGQRKMVSLDELSGMEGEVVTMQQIFAWEQTGVDAQGRAQGRFQVTGVRPRFLDRIERMGFQMPPGLFTQRSEEMAL